MRLIACSIPRFHRARQGESMLQTRRWEAARGAGGDCPYDRARVATCSGAGNSSRNRTVSDGRARFGETLGARGGCTVCLAEGKTMRKTFGCFMAVAVAAFALSLQAAAPIRVMLLDGANNHDWKATSPVIVKILDETGLFQTARVTVDNAEIDRFKPDWTQYDVVVLNYNTGIGSDAPQWLPEVRASFQRYVAGGGGLVSVHAADNAFAGWPEFNEMIGVGGWGNRDEHSGPYWYFKDDKLVKDDAPGRAGSHGARLPFQVVVRDAAHPVTGGLPKMWMHHNDELYAQLRGPGKNMTILAT